MAILSLLIAVVMLFAYLQDLGRCKTSEEFLDVGRIYSKHKYYTFFFFEEQERRLNTYGYSFNTLRTGDADLHFYITTVQDG